jgi:hypothetical protein
MSFMRIPDNEPDPPYHTTIEGSFTVVSDPPKKTPDESIGYGPDGKKRHLPPESKLDRRF